MSNKQEIDWYYGVEGQAQGPVGFTELKHLATRGVLRPETLVWNDGLDDWQEARSIEGLVFESPLALTADTPENKQSEKPQPVMNGYRENENSLLTAFRNNPGWLLGALASGVFLVLFGLAVVAGMSHPESNDVASETLTMNEPMDEDGFSGESSQVPVESPSVSLICANYATKESSQKTNLLEVSFRFQNHTNAPVRVDYEQFSLSDGQNTYESTSDYHTYFEYPRYATVNPNTAKNFSVMFEIPHPGQYFFNTPDIQPIALNPQKNCLAEGIQQAADDMGWESNETESEKPTEASKPIAKTKASDRQTMTTSPDDSLYSLDPPRSVIPRMSHPRVQPEAVPIPIPMSPTKAPDWNGYINAITPKMMAWHPPEIAESSSVTVTMQIAKDGTLLRSEVKTPSGNPQIDDAAMQAVQVASPFPPLPAGYQQDSASIDYRFDYFGSAPKSRKKR